MGKNMGPNQEGLVLLIGAHWDSLQLLTPKNKGGPHLCSSALSYQLLSWPRMGSFIRLIL